MVQIQNPIVAQVNKSAIVKNTDFNHQTLCILDSLCCTSWVFIKYVNTTNHDKIITCTKGTLLLTSACGAPFKDLNETNFNLKMCTKSTIF